MPCRAEPSMLGVTATLIGVLAASASMAAARVVAEPAVSPHLLPAQDQQRSLGSQVSELQDFFVAVKEGRRELVFDGFMEGRMNVIFFNAFVPLDRLSMRALTNAWKLEGRVPRMEVEFNLPDCVDPDGLSWKLVFESINELLPGGTYLLSENIIRRPNISGYPFYCPFSTRADRACTTDPDDLDGGGRIKIQVRREGLGSDDAVFDDDCVRSTAPTRLWLECVPLPLPIGQPSPQAPAPLMEDDLCSGGRVYAYSRLDQETVAIGGCKFTDDGQPVCINGSVPSVVTTCGVSCIDCSASCGAPATTKPTTTPGPSLSPSVAPSATGSPSFNATRAPSASQTPTPSITASVTPTRTPTPSITPSPSVSPRRSEMPSAMSVPGGRPDFVITVPGAYFSQSPAGG